MFPGACSSSERDTTRKETPAYPSPSRSARASALACASLTPLKRVEDFNAPVGWPTALMLCLYYWSRPRCCRSAGGYNKTGWGILKTMGGVRPTNRKSSTSLRRDARSGVRDVLILLPRPPRA